MYWLAMIKKWQIDNLTDLNSDMVFSNLHSDLTNTFKL